MIFFDNASTTKPSEKSIETMEFYLKERFFNPSAPYHPSVVAATDLQDFREKCSRFLRATRGKIIFTSSGTESDNLALFGSRKPNGSRIIVSASEHPAVARGADELKNKGFDVVFCPVDRCGRVETEVFQSLMTKETSFVSIMHVNNETGGINDIKNLVRIAKAINPKVIFHSDGVQALGKIPVSLDDLGVDLYSFSGHKIHSPRGVGGLYVKNDVHLHPILFGGGQEFNVRSSTENLAGIAAFCTALQDAVTNFSENYDRVKEVNRHMREGLLQGGDKYLILSDEECSPYILYVSLKYVRGEVMLHSLEKYDIFIGTGSACSSKKPERNFAKIAHLAPEYEKGLLRISFDENTTIEEVDYFINKLNLEYNFLEKYMRG